MHTSRRALVLSPTATHPRDHGNRNRVWQITNFLRREGYEIHFVLYPMEEDWQSKIPSSFEAMRAEWPAFTVVPPSVALHNRAAGEYHTIDEWWDPQIGHYLQWLLARQSFTVFLVNYAFLSKAFEFVPGPTVKVLETHDILSGRKEMLASLGVDPEFFYTTAEQEQIAFDRADIVVAIKDSEAQAISRRTGRSVVALPFFPEEIGSTAVSRRPEPGDILRVGFVGANNQVNIANVKRFLKVYGKYEQVFSPPMEIWIAGGICRELQVANPTVKLLGRVDDLRDFYADVDVVTVPLMLSTGIKIKTAEAMGYGLPVVSTANGFDGYPAVDEYHALPDYAGVCDALMKLAFDRSRLAMLHEHTRMAAQLAERRTGTAYRRLAGEVKRHAARIAIVTDQDVTGRPTVAEERLAQWIELCSHIAPTLVVLVGDRSSAPRARGELLADLHASEVEFVEPSPDLAADLNKALLEQHAMLPIGEMIVSIAGDYRAAVVKQLRASFPALTVDLWAGDMVRELDLSEEEATEFDLWTFAPGLDMVPERGRGLLVAPLRYIPDRLLRWKSRDIGEQIALVRCDPDEGDQIALEILRHRFARTGGICVVGNSEAGSDCPETELWDYLIANKKPQCMVALGTDWRKARLYRALAEHAGIEFGRIACRDLPYLHELRDGDAVLCISPRDAANCAHMPLRARPTAEMIENAWDCYWDLASAKIRRFRDSGAKWDTKVAGA
jgi:glycosyltransferase involved in cell wall biosynthesis